MRRRYKPFPILEGEQAEAVDPEIHAAVKASAGTGKTQVLTGRVLNLLLSGARPETIFCITFTKAAAAEMANRISGQLAAWVRLPDKDLKKDLFALRAPDNPDRQGTGAAAVREGPEAPGGLRAGDGALRALAGARVGLGSLAAHRKTATMPQTLVAADFDLASDVGLHLAAQVTFDLDLGVALDVVAQLRHFNALVRSSVCRLKSMPVADKISCERVRPMP